MRSGQLAAYGHYNAIASYNQTIKFLELSDWFVLDDFNCRIRHECCVTGRKKIARGLDSCHYGHHRHTHF
jgi:hypothetical protein